MTDEKAPEAPAQKSSIGLILKIVYGVVAVCFWAYYCHYGSTQYNKVSFNFGLALAWPLSMWQHR